MVGCDPAGEGSIPSSHPNFEFVMNQYVKRFVIVLNSENEFEPEEYWQGMSWTEDLGEAITYKEHDAHDRVFALRTTFPHFKRRMRVRKIMKHRSKLKPYERGM